ncbi:tyrosine-type recombinase/integrase [Salmonella enterica]|nr:tyrosine-type recombinase/integrase [Salmonella enterica]
MTLKYRIKRLKNKDGIRSCIIINESNGLPLVYPNLYMSVISRTNSYSFSTMEAIANALLLFERYNADMNVGVFDMVNSDIEKLVSNKGYLFGLMNALTYRNDLEKVTSILREQHVSKRTLYFKIMTVENYVKWYFDNIAINNIDSSRYETISRAFDFIKPRIENGKNYNIESESKSLTNEQVTTLTDMVSVKSKNNPFSEHVRFRNNLIIEILLETGIRGGELLNIKLVDFYYVHKSLCIVRRPDDQNEPRLRQPLVKTLERKIPLSIELTELIQNYISDFRSKQCHAGEHGYLLVTHSSKGQLGHALTISGYQKIFEQIRKNSNILSDIVGHSLRHTWNVKFSEMMLMNSNSQDYITYEKVRNYLMGWKKNSTTSDIYNQAFIAQESRKIMAVINPLKNIVEDKSNVSNSKKATRKSIFGF